MANKRDEDTLSENVRRLFRTSRVGRAVFAGDCDDRGRPIGEDGDPVGPRENDDQDEPADGKHPINVHASAPWPGSPGSCLSPWSARTRSNRTRGSVYGWRSSRSRRR